MFTERRRGRGADEHMSAHTVVIGVGMSKLGEPPTGAGRHRPAAAREACAAGSTPALA